MSATSEEAGRVAFQDEITAATWTSEGAWEPGVAPAMVAIFAECHETDSLRGASRC